MMLSTTIRRLLLPALAVMLVCSGAPSVWGQRSFHVAGQARGGEHPLARQQAPRQPEMRSAPAMRPQQATRPGQGQRRNQEHLEQWMQQHSNMSLAEQQKALEKEPGFRSLPPDVQQRFHNRLAQLNSMPPAQRQRWLEHTEAMERLTPPERKQVRGALQQLGALPDNRRRLVARAFRDLREMPPEQRQTILNSDRFRGQFSDRERSTLSNLLLVEPYIPADRPNENQQQGK